MDRSEHDISEILTRTAVFKYLNIHQIQSIQPYGRLIQYHENDIILAQGGEGEGLYVLLKGKADVAVSVLGEGRAQLAKLMPGSFFGEVTLFENTPCTATVIAKEPSLCFVLSRECYDAFAIGQIEIKHLIDRAILEEVIKRQRILNEKIANLIVSLRQTKPAKSTRVTTDFSKHRVSMKKADMAKFDYLHHLPLFKILDTKEFANFISNSNKLELIDRTVLIEQNKNMQSCFLVLSGAVLMTVNHQHKRAKITVHGPNTFICPISLLNKQIDMYTYTTIGPALLLEVTPDYLQYIESHDKQLWYKFNDLFSRYIISLQGKLNTLYARLTTEHVVSFIKE